MALFHHIKNMGTGSRHDSSLVLVTIMHSEGRRASRPIDDGLNVQFLEICGVMLTNSEILLYLYNEKFELIYEGQFGLASLDALFHEVYMYYNTMDQASPLSRWF